MINEEYIHCYLVGGLDSVLRALPDVASLPFRSDAVQASVTSMTLWRFLGPEGDTLDSVLGGEGSIHLVRVQADRHSVTRALDDPVRFICANWPLGRTHRRQLQTRAMACRASLLHRLGLLSVPRGVDRSVIPTVSVGDAFDRSHATDVLIGEIAQLYGLSHTFNLDALFASVGFWLDQRIPADLLAAYWHRYRGHFLVAQFGPGPVRDLVMADRLDGLTFGPDESYLRYLDEPQQAGSGAAGHFILSASISQGSLSALRIDERGLVQGLPAGPSVPSEPRKLTVLLHPSRTVFGHRVQVESDGREVFVKPVADDGK